MKKFFKYILGVSLLSSLVSPAFSDSQTTSPTQNKENYKDVSYISDNIKPYIGKTIEADAFRIKGDNANSLVLEVLSDKVKNLENCEFAIPLSFNEQDKAFQAKDNTGYILCPNVETYLKVNVSINDGENKSLNGIDDKTKKSILVSIK